MSTCVEEARAKKCHWVASGHLVQQCPSCGLSDAKDRPIALDGINSLLDEAKDDECM